MNKIVIDLDGTLTVGGGEYIEVAPRSDVVKALREYHSQGYEIVIYTARNMRTHEGQVGKINIHTVPIILEWLNKHDIPHDELIVGKPWCGPDGFYVDDRAVRPSEFATKSPSEIEGILREDAKCF